MLFIMVQEDKMHRLEALSNPTLVAIEAIRFARNHMEPEEAVEFFDGLLEKPTEDFAVVQQLRLQLVELNFELDRRDAAKKHLGRLIVPSDE